MTLKNRFPQRPTWLIRWTQYEYWPWMMLYIPSALRWIWHAIRLRSLTYFTAVNPGIEDGGFYGESKIDILKLIPEIYRPATFYVQPENDPRSVIATIAYPLIAKPNIGQRGEGVEKIEDETKMLAYHRAAKAPYLIQAFVNYPVEVAVLWSKLPGQTTGIVSSVTLKEFLAVTGDGVRTLETLIRENPRARFHIRRLYHRFQPLWDTVIPNEQQIVLEKIGNHSLGTRFINANYLIDARLQAVFDEIGNQIPGFFYGRFDLRVPTLEDLFQGKNIAILELNGLSSDPAHIYDTTTGLLQVWRTLLWHVDRCAEIAKVNMKAGVKLSAFKTLYQKFRLYS